MSELDDLRLRIDRLRAGLVKIRDLTDEDNYRDRPMPTRRASFFNDLAWEALDDDDELSEWQAQAR